MSIPINVQQAFAAYRLGGDKILPGRARELREALTDADWEWVRNEEPRWRQTQERSATSRAFLEIMLLLEEAS